jgi:hypothetical protein
MRAISFISRTGSGETRTPCNQAESSVTKFGKFSPAYRSPASTLGSIKSKTVVLRYMPQAGIPRIGMTTEGKTQRELSFLS